MASQEAVRLDLGEELERDVAVQSMQTHWSWASNPKHGPHPGIRYGLVSWKDGPNPCSPHCDNRQQERRGTFLKFSPGRHHPLLASWATLQRLPGQPGSPPAPTTVRTSSLFSSFTFFPPLPFCSSMYSFLI